MLTIGEKAHRTFKRDGNDLLMIHRLPLVDALCDSMLEVRPVLRCIGSWLCSCELRGTGLVGLVSCSVVSLEMHLQEGRQPAHDPPPAACGRTVRLRA